MSLQIFGDFGFSAGFDETANPYQDAQVCINWYPEIAASEQSQNGRISSAKEVVALLGCPGLIEVAADPNGGAPGFTAAMTAWPAAYSGANLPVRGMWVLPGWTKAIVVIANKAYLATVSQRGSLTQAGTLGLMEIGTLSTSSGYVCIRDNGAGGQVAIVDGPYGYFCDQNGGDFRQIGDPAFLGATTVAFIDGWWVFSKPESQVFFTNTPQYSTTFDGTYFALKDSSTDNLVACVELKEELWLIGERTTEPWYDAGGQFFPFQRLVGAPLQVGCGAVGSVQKLVSTGQEGLIWLGRSERGENMVVRTRGFTYEEVSTDAIAVAISKYQTTSDAIGYVYEEGGHEFYVLNFPSADVTWVYDATMPPELAWHQRASYDPYSQTLHRHRSNCYMNFGGMRVVGDYQNGTLYQMTRAAHTDAGWPILARRRSPYIWNKENRERVFIASLQIDFAPGQGNSSGLGTNPVARLAISRDYGTTYGPAEPQPMGAIGGYLNRCMWRRRGWSRGAVAQIEVIDPVNRDLVGATLRAFGT